MHLNLGLRQRNCSVLRGSGETSIVESLNTKWRQRHSGLARRACGTSRRIEDDLVERFFLLVEQHSNTMIPVARSGSAKKQQRAQINSRSSFGCSYSLSMSLTQEQLLDLDKEMLVEIVLRQSACIGELEATSATLTRQVARREDRLNQTRKNSSKPPSSELPLGPTTVPKNQKMGTKSGGQPSHQGYCLKKVAQPDRVEEHPPRACIHCGYALLHQCLPGQPAPFRSWTCPLTSR